MSEAREAFKPLIRAIAELVGTDDQTYAVSKAVEVVNQHAPSIAEAVRADAVAEYQEAIREAVEAQEDWWDADERADEQGAEAALERCMVAHDRLVALIPEPTEEVEG